MGFKVVLPLEVSGESEKYHRRFNELGAEFVMKHRIMKRITSTILTVSFCLLLSIPCSFARTDKRNEITIVIPAKVLEKSINDVLPIKITRDKEFSGVIWVQSIDRLKLGIDKVSFLANIHGEDIKYKGKIGKLPASLSFGSIDASFNCEASIRYDEEKNILYVKPKITEETKRREVLWLLLKALIGDKEYPVEIQKLKPIIARFSDKSVAINMDISDIYTVNDRLFIALSPNVKVSNE